jgi:hypothetical protein
MDLEKEIFKGKKISDIAKEAYDRHKSQSEQIQTEIDRLSNMVSSPGDAIVLVPEIKNLIDSSLKNDEVLIKLLQTYQKIAAADSSAASAEGILTQKDIDQLFSEVSTSAYERGETKQLPNS